MARTFSGTSEGALAPFLNQAFWSKAGTKIEGVILQPFKTTNGTSYNVSLRKPILLNGEKYEKVSIGLSAGLQMALRDAGVPNAEFLPGDAVIIEMTGTKKATDPNMSDMTLFKVNVSRP